MSEMLGNQYFLAGNYGGAAKEFAKVLHKDPHNLYVLRKLVICHTQTGNIQEALRLTANLLKFDAAHFSRQHDNDDLQCARLIQAAEHTNEENSSPERMATLGLLWLYCDVDKALPFFQKARTKKEFGIIDDIVRLLQSKSS